MEVYSNSEESHKNKYWRTASDLSIVEECLLSPQNQQVFLTASMAFLQRRLDDKLDKKQNNSNNKKVVRYASKRSYSSLLVFEIDDGISSERYFVRVQNTEKYEQLLKRECILCSRGKLSLEQILPKPRKPKSESKGFIERLKSSSLKISITRDSSEPKKSVSFLTIFKRSTPSPSQSNLSCMSASSVNLKLPSTPSENGLPSGFIKPQRTESSCSYVSIKIDEAPRACSRTESTVLKPMILKPEEVEILQLIPSSPSCCYRKHFPRPRKSRNFQQEYCIPSDRSDSSVRTHASNCSNSVRVCSSKLSVCLEDEEGNDNEEEEEEEYEIDKESILNVSSYNSCNLTDELKSNFSTDDLHITMRRLMNYFEYNIPGIKKQRSR